MKHDCHTHMDTNNDTVDFLNENGMRIFDNKCPKVKIESLVNSNIW